LQVLVVRLHADENTYGETKDLYARGGGSAHVRLHGSILSVVDLDAVLNVASLLGTMPFKCSNHAQIEPEGGGACYLEVPVEFVE
jgi:hypothetical protein